MAREWPAFGFELCRAIKDVLEEKPPGCEISKRATNTLQSLRHEFGWLTPGQTTLLNSSDGTRWWTFGGLLANSTIAQLLRQLGIKAGKADNFAIRIDDRDTSLRWDSIMGEMRSIPESDIVASIDPKTLSQLKFSSCLPDDLATKELELRLSNPDTCAKLISETVAVVREMQDKPLSV